MNIRSFALSMLAIFMAVAIEQTATASGVAEVYLPDYHATKLAEDEPFRDIVLRSAEEKNGKTTPEIWLVGKTCLWRLNIADQSMRRYRLIEEPGQELHRILVDQVDGSLLVASSAGVYDVEPSSGKIFHYPLPEGVKASTTGLFGIGDLIVWTTETDLLQLDRYGRRLQRTDLPQSLRGATSVFWSPAMKAFWFGKGQSVGLYRLDGSDRASQVWLAPATIEGITADNSSIFAWTKSAVGRFSLDNEARGPKKLAELNVANKRQLSLAAVGRDYQSWLFSDGTLEVYESKSRSRKAFKLPLTPTALRKKQSRLVMAGPDGNDIALLVIDGKFRIFSLIKAVRGADGKGAQKKL